MPVAIQNRPARTRRLHPAGAHGAADVPADVLRPGAPLGGSTVLSIRDWTSPLGNAWRMIRLDDGSLFVRRSDDTVRIADLT